MSHVITVCVCFVFFLDTKCYLQVMCVPLDFDRELIRFLITIIVIVSTIDTTLAMNTDIVV